MPAIPAPVLSQNRGDYDDALDWYQQSLRIQEELGNRAGMARSLSQIGVLLTETGKAAEGVVWNLRSLGIRLPLRVPEVRIDLHWLGRQREALGEEGFLEVLEEELDEDNRQAVLQLMEQYEAAQSGDGEADGVESGNEP